MKHLLSLNNEYILETKFLANQIKGDNGYYFNDYIDEKKDKCNGKQNVSHVILMVELLDRDGYHGSIFQKVWLDKNDILKLAEKINELDAVKLIGTPGDDLPF